MFYGSERFGTVRLEAERFGKLVMDCHETHKKHTKTLHFPDGVEQELAEITESAWGKIFCHGKARKDAERRGKEWILEWHGRRDGSDKGCRERFGMEDPLVGSPGCHSVTKPATIDLF